jgi:hypothetical protein
VEGCLSWRGLRVLSIKLSILPYHIPCLDSLKGTRGSSQDGQFTFRKLQQNAQPSSRNDVWDRQVPDLCLFILLCLWFLLWFSSSSKILSNWLPLRSFLLSLNTHHTITRTVRYNWPFVLMTANMEFLSVHGHPSHSPLFLRKHLNLLRCGETRPVRTL